MHGAEESPSGSDIEDLVTDENLDSRGPGLQVRPFSAFLKNSTVILVTVSV